jgi:hypothetical protein
MDVVHCSSQGIELGSRFAALLQLPLKAAKNDVETQTRLSGRSNASHPTQSLLSESSALGCSKGEILRTTSTANDT